MKKLLLLALAFTLTVGVHAQIPTPAPSPAAKIEQTVGLTDVTVEYSRPAMRGRTIYGDLVPYGKIWRTGANANTKITFSDDVTIGDAKVKAGSYAILSIPNADNWDVVFYTDTNVGASPKELEESKTAARVNIKTTSIPMSIESFTINIHNLSSSGATLDIIWENTLVSVPFSVPTDATVMSAIEKAMGGPGFGEYYAAASYFYAEGKDIAKAKKWIDKAMSMTKNPRFWQLRQQSLIYAAAGDKAGAIGLAKKSLAAAEEAGNADYVKMNKESIAEWQ